MSADLRVLLTADSVGGVWQHALDLARALVPLGIDPVIAQLGPPLRDAQRGEAAGVRVIETGLPLDWLVADAAPIVAAADALSALARRERADVVHVTMPTLAAALRCDVPVVAAVHGCVATWWEAVRGGALDPAFDWHRAMTAAGLRAADAVVAPSAAFAGAVTRSYALERPIRVVHNGRRAEPLPAVARRDVAFTAGRLWDAAKRAPLMDAVAARLRVGFRAAGATVGPHGETVRLDQLTLLGALDARGMATELAARPVFVSAASFEPFGLAVLEAAQAGCALVLADNPVFRELWDGAATFVAGDDADAYAAAIETLIAAPAARAGAGTAARERAARYTPAVMAAGVRAIYAEALAGTSVRERAA